MSGRFYKGTKRTFKCYGEPCPSIETQIDPAAALEVAVEYAAEGFCILSDDGGIDSVRAIEALSPSLQAKICGCMAGSFEMVDGEAVAVLGRPNRWLRFNGATAKWTFGSRTGRGIVSALSALRGLTSEETVKIIREALGAGLLEYLHYFAARKKTGPRA